MEMNVKNLSQLKKWLSVGKEVEFVKNVVCPEKADGIRRITKVQTNGFYTERGKDSWLALPKAKDLIFEEDLIKFITVFYTEDEYITLQRQRNSSNKDIRAIAKREEERLEKRRKELYANGAEFLDDSRYIWLEIRLVG